MISTESEKETESELDKRKQKTIRTKITNSISLSESLVFFQRMIEKIWRKPANDGKSMKKEIETQIELRNEIIKMRFYIDILVVKRGPLNKLFVTTELFRRNFFSVILIYIKRPKNLIDAIFDVVNCHNDCKLLINSESLSTVSTPRFSFSP